MRLKIYTRRKPRFQFADVATLDAAAVAIMLYDIKFWLKAQLNQKKKKKTMDEIRMNRMPSHKLCALLIRVIMNKLTLLDF